MLRLTAILVANTRLRPWRTGWSIDRGVDFRTAAATPAVAVPPVARPGTTDGERACFIEADEGAATGVRPTAAEALQGAPAEAPGARGLQAWWSLSGKPSRT